MFVKKKTLVAFSCGKFIYIGMICSPAINFDFYILKHCTYE